MEINWNAAPDGFPFWLEGIGEHACWSGWYRRRGEVFEGSIGGQFRSVREGQFFTVHTNPEGWAEACAHSEANRLGCPECGADFGNEQYQPAPWTGEGLPPVGTVCEWHGPNSDGPNGWVYAESKVVAYTEDGLFVCMQAPSYWPVVQRIDNCDFRPIRTPEQIAAEERSLAVSEIISAIGWTHGTAGAAEAAERIYDAGYRKQVQP